ncbi:MAG: alkylation response protein AidB-like acyl-CoA dehydrogenase [Maribacter sp.]|jgi:alkylation response protein AidB-like acyl-CoA dehydrogenase
MSDIIVKNVLKGGEFIIKDSAPEDIFIPEEWDEEQQMVKQTVIDFVEQVGTRGNKIANQVELLSQAGELGFLGCHIPDEYGGMLMDTNTVTMICDQIGAISGGWTTSFAAHTGIGMLPILYFGTEEVKQKYLPELAMGSKYAAYCLTEPSSGSDALAAKTKAELSADGKNYILNGQKMWISNAGFAHVFIVFAQVDGDKFTGFVVDADSKGISLGAEEDKMGIKGSSTRQVFFENTEVPVGNVLGEVGKGHLIAFNVLNVGRFKLGALAVGGCRASSTISVQYANERKQFKQSISNFGAIQYKLAEQAIRTFALESSVYRVSDMLKDKKDNLVAGGMSYSDALLEAAEEYAVECALMKVYGSEAADYVVDETVQIHGGNGFSEEYPAAQAYRDARINRIYEGTNEINRMLSVSMLLKKAMKGQLDIVGPAWTVQKELASMPDLSKPEGTYGEEVKAIQNFKKMILMVAGTAAKEQMDGKINLKEEQEILMNVSDMMIDCFNAESTLLRVQKLANRDKQVDQAVYDAILKTYIYDATSRVVKSATDALASFTEGDMLSVMLRGVKRFGKYPPQNVKVLRRTIAKALIDANSYCL